MPDRPVHLLEIEAASWPLPPLNVSCLSAYINGTYDVRWTSPTELQANSHFTIYGVNIYRSFDSEFGPYTRVNALPIGINFFRDNSRVRMVVDEDVTDQFVNRGDTGPTYEWTFRTGRSPIVIDGPHGEADILSLNVQVRVGDEPANLLRVQASLGEITLSPYDAWDSRSETAKKSPLPRNGERVYCTYRFMENVVESDMGKRIFYRITTVGRNARGELLETPIEQATQANNHQVEKLDYIWREAIRRNRFILVQGGERVKCFIRKAQGQQCGCWSVEHQQPAATCELCYGVGIVGGYEGPFDIIIAPDDADRNVNQEARGRTLQHAYDSWTSPSPLLSHRDFVVKANGERYAIGPVRMPSNRGMQLQQFFQISHLDSKDIRHKVPVMDTSTLIIPHTQWIDPAGGKSLPMVTERNRIPDEREERGHTVAWENAQRR